MPLVRSNDAPDSADPVRCASQPSFKPSSVLFFPPNRVFLGRGERAFEASHGERTSHQARIRRWISPHHLGSPPSSRHRSLTRAVYPASLAGPAPYSVWCRPPVHRLTMRTLEAPAEGSGAARTAAGAHTAAIRARRSSTPTTSASTLRSSLPPDAKMRVALNSNPPRSITPEIASRPNRTRLVPALTGTWVTAGSSARAAAPSSA